MKQLPVLLFILPLLFLSSCAEEEEEKVNDNPYNGVQTSYYPDGKTVKLKYSVVKGVKQGLTTQFYDTGQKHTEVNFKDGEMDGEAVMFFKTGEVNRKTPYQMGRKQGMQRGYYKSTGDLKYEMPFQNDSPQPGLKHYEEDGSVLEEPVIQFESNSDGTFIASVSPKYGKAEYFYAESDYRDGQEGLSMSTRIDSKKSKCTVRRGSNIGAKAFAANRTVYIIFGTAN